MVELGQALGFFGGGEVAEGFFGGGDGGVEGGELVLDGGDAVFELLELDGVEALDGGGGWRRNVPEVLRTASDCASLRMTAL